MARISTAWAAGMAGLAIACIGVQRPSVSSMQEVLEDEPGKDAPFTESLEPGDPGQGALRVDIAQRFQTLEGFGASVAWHHDRITGATPEDLYEFLFPQLGLDILRFRNRFERTDGQDGRLAQEKEIFERATTALGHKPKLLLSAWSPPARLKANGREKCNGNADCTLKKNNGQFMYAEYAAWWKASLEQYEALGMRPDFVSIQNEPDFIPPDWEGCKLDAQESSEYPGYGKALKAVYDAFQGVQNAPKLLGPEVLGVHYERVQKYLAGMDSNLVYGVAHHIYERGNDAMWDWRDPGPDSFLDELAAVAQATEKPLFQTEFNTDEDRGIDGGFETAWLLHHSLVAEGAAAFLYWDLIWDGNKGLVGMLGKTPKPRDHYYSLKHFAAFTDPGYVRVAVSSDKPELIASAYVAPDAKRLVIVALNTSKTALDAAVDGGTFNPNATKVFRTSYRPGQSRRWEELGALPAEKKLRLPARSVATIVFEG